MEIVDSKFAKKIENGKIELTDFNGKTIVTTFDEITDATGDFDNNFSDINNSNVENANIICSITDSEGNIINQEDLISSIDNGEVIALDVTFEATHTNRIINSAIYTQESMAEDVTTFMAPFGKPLIKNHDIDQEPLGRIINAYYDESQFLEDCGTINATWRVTDSDAMKKFADGRYKTMSIGASSNKIVCNTCGKTILDNGRVKFCGHWRGQTYKDNLCTWTMTGLNYKEGSIVNSPADPYAQVKNIRVVKKKSDKGVNDMENNNNSNQNGVLGQMDNILNGNTSQEQNTDKSDDKTQAKDTQDNAQENNELETIKNELAAVKNELMEAKNDITIKDGEIQALKAEKIVLESKIQNSQEKLVAFANYNKSLLIDKAITLDSNLKVEDLEKQSLSQIGAVINSLETIRRKPGTVNNPTLSNRDHEDEATGANVTDSENNANSNKDGNCNNLKDYEDIVFKFLNK